MPRQPARLFWPFAFTMLACALLVALGTWQMQRLAWKEGLITQITARAKAPPAPLPDVAEWPSLRLEAYEYRHVELEGTFEHDKEALVFWASGRGPAGGNEPGFLVLTPLRLKSGALVIVNRGFVPQSLTERSARIAGEIAGETYVTGLMRAPEPRTLFMPPDDPAKGRYFARDPAPIAARLSGMVAPFLVDADDLPVPGGWPKGGTTELILKNSHLSYALTWFGLALACLGVFAVFAGQRLKPRNASAANGITLSCL